MKKARENKKKLLQSIFTQMNFGLQYKIKMLSITKHSIGNICVGLEIYCILQEMAKQGLKRVTSP